MLINLTGPPASGKSTLLTMWNTEFQGINCISIDQMRRRYQDEDEAWYQTTKSIQTHTHTILESSGTSFHLQADIFSHPCILKYGIKTIILYGRKEEFLYRLSIRKKAAVPFPYKGLSIENLIDHTQKELPIRYKEAIWIASDDRRTLQETYQQFRKTILQIIVDPPCFKEEKLGNSNTNNPSGDVSQIIHKRKKEQK